MIRYIQIGEHTFQITSHSDSMMHRFERDFHAVADTDDLQPHMIVHIEDGYGVPFLNFDVEITKQSNRIFYRRADYCIEVDNRFKAACVSVYNAFALKHALMNLYSSFIVYNKWGLLIHSSCVIEEGEAHIFAGRSGTGKSTTAKLSYPRVLLSDEATIVKISGDGSTIFNSPFRSELEATHMSESRPLASIQLLVQDLVNSRMKVSRANSLLQLLDKVFYWTHDADEMNQVFGLLKQMVSTTPVFELHFQKDNTFWELISS